MGPKDYNDACDANVGGTRKVDTDGVGDDDGATTGYDDPKGASNGGRGIASEGIPPNCEPCWMMTFFNDVAAWRVCKSIDYFTTDGRITWDIGLFIWVLTWYYLIN